MVQAVDIVLRLSLTRFAGHWLCLELQPGCVPSFLWRGTGPRSGSAAAPGGHGGASRVDWVVHTSKGRLRADGGRLRAGNCIALPGSVPAGARDDKLLVWLPARDCLKHRPHKAENWGHLEGNFRVLVLERTRGS